MQPNANLVPLNSLRKEIFHLLEFQTNAIYGRVPASASLPYILIGQCTLKPDGSKTSFNWLVSLTVHCYADLNKQGSVNEMIDDVCTLIQTQYGQMTIDGYSVTSCRVDLIEDFEDDNHCDHGVVTFLLNLAKEE